MVHPTLRRQRSPSGVLSDTALWGVDVTRLVLLALLVLLIVALAWRETFGFNTDLPERENLQRWIDAAGLLGPVVVVALMTVAIVASPLPSAPVALAAGAAYGHTFGTMLVVLGAELGAVIAFLRISEAKR